MDRRVGLVALALIAAPCLGGCLSANNGGGDSLDAGGAPDDAASLVVNDATSGFVDGAPTTIDAGPPVIATDGTATMDFGMADCGGDAPASKSFNVMNVGGRTAHWALSISGGSAFQIVGASSGDIPPAASATITIAASAVPASATAGQVDQATLTVTTNDPAHPSVDVTLKRTARGGSLTLAPATVAFGDVPVRATSGAVPVALTNAGNGPVSVTLGAPTDPQFTLAWDGADAGSATLAPAGALPNLAATFAPSASGAANATAAIQVTGAVCGGSASSIALQGNGTIGVVAVTPGTLDFKSVSCGKATTAQSVQIANSGGAAFHWTAALLGGASSPYTITPTSGSVDAGKSATVTVTPKAIPQVASTASNAFGDTLRITSDAVGDANHDVALKETAQGAVLSIDHAALAFNQVNVGSTSSMPFAITNSGNLAATITLGAPGGAFGRSPTAATAVSPGATPLAGSATFKPTATGAQSATVTITTGASDVLCSAPLAPIALTGTGINGTLSLSTNTIAFGSVSCGQKGAPQTFDVSNSGTASFSWSAALGKGASSPYTLSPSSGTLAPKDKTTVTVTPSAVPFPSALTNDLYGDTITITPTGISGGAAQQVALTETAKGAIVAVSASSIPYASQPEGQPTTATLTFTNSGTMAVTLTPTISGGNTSSFSLQTPGAHTLAAGGGNYSPGPTFDPQATGTLSSSVAFSIGANDVLCQALPAAVSLSGTGTNGVLSVGSASVAIAQPCGSATAQTGAVKLTNTGTAALSWNASVLGTSGLKVSPTSGSLAVNGTTSLTITSPTFSSTWGNVKAVGDTLRVTTNAFGDGNHDVPLTTTPTGAILAFGETGYAFGNVQATPSGTKPSTLGMTVINSGNQAATVSFAEGTGGKTEYTFAPQNTSIGAGSKLTTGKITFDPTYVATQNDTIRATVPAGTNLCAALPSEPLSGTGAAGTVGPLATGVNVLIGCNAGSATQYVSLTNPKGAVPYDFTASAGGGYGVSPASGTVAPNASVQLAITSPSIGTVAYGTSYSGTLSVTTDIPGDAAHTIAIGGSADGAVLSFSDPNGVYISGGATGTGTLHNAGSAQYVGAPYVVPGANNPAAITLSADLTFASAGDNAVHYTWNADQQTPAGYYQYTVYYPYSASGTAFVCSAQTSEFVQATNLIP